MKIIWLLDTVLTVILLSGITMAADIQHLAGIPISPAIKDRNTAPFAVETRASCDAAVVDHSAGFTLCASMDSGKTGATTSFAVTHDRPVKDIKFIQVVN